MRALEQAAVDAGATWPGLMEQAGWGVALAGCAAGHAEGRAGELGGHGAGGAGGCSAEESGENGTEGDAAMEAHGSPIFGSRRPN